MKDYILASRRALFGTDKVSKCDICGHEAYYNYKSHVLQMGDHPIPIVCTQCVLQEE